MSELRVPFVGVQLFCPDCGRWLVQVHEDGTATINSRTIFRGSGRGQVDEDNSGGVPEDLVITEALCMKKPCRFKRRLRLTTGGV